MSKILRKAAQIFGVSAGPNQLAQVGSLAAAAPVFSTDPDTIQALANYAAGWFSCVVGANSPAIEDMNALCYLFAYQIAYSLQAGIAEWDATTPYYTGSVVTINAVPYVSIVDNNVNHNPATAILFWKPLLPKALNPQANFTLAQKALSVWATETAAAADAWSGLVWSPEKSLFVAVSTTGTLMSSPDGVTWTTRTASAASTWRSVTWSPMLKLFCAVADAGATRVMTSPDGITWTSRTAAGTGQWHSVCWSPELGLFAAVSIGGSAAMYSSDGVTWTLATATTATWTSVCWSSMRALFVAVDGAGTVMHSPDGVTWSPASTVPEANVWTSVCFSEELGIFVAVSSSGTHRVMTSIDGDKWVVASAAAANAWQSVSWSPQLGAFVALSSTGANRVMISPDGATWLSESAAAADSWDALCWSPQLGVFGAVSSTGTVMISRYVLKFIS